MLAELASRPASHELFAKSDQVLHDMLLADLNQLDPDLIPAGAEEFHRIYRWHEALPKFNVGYFGKLKAFADGEIEVGKLVFAGDYLGGPFIEGAITSGLDAARRLLEGLKA